MNNKYFSTFSKVTLTNSKTTTTTSNKATSSTKTKVPQLLVSDRQQSESTKKVSTQVAKKPVQSSLNSIRDQTKIKDKSQSNSCNDNTDQINKQQIDQTTLYQEMQKIDQSRDQDELITPATKKFLDIFDHNLVMRISSYLQLSDMVKFATLSRKIRKLVPLYLKSFDSKNILRNIYDTKGTNYPLYQQAEDLVLRQIEFSRIKMKDRITIIDFMKEYNKKKLNNKVYVTQTLNLGVNIVLNLEKNSENAIQLIQKRGIFKMFEDISLDYMKTTIIKTQLPDKFYEGQTVISPLIKLIYQHVICVQQNKFSKQEQIKAAALIKRQHYFIQFSKVNEELLFRYQKCFLCFKKTNNVLNYLNRNNISVIIPFLTNNEILNLLSSNKQIQQLIKEYLQNKIQQNKVYRAELMKQHKLDDQQIEAIIYLMHFDWLDDYQNGVIQWNYLQSNIIGDMFRVLFDVLDQDESNILVNSKQSNSDKYWMKHDLNKLNCSKANVISNALDKYTDQVIDSLPIKSRNNLDNRVQMIYSYLQKYLKGILLFIQLNMNLQKVEQLKSIYINHIYSIDQHTHQYQRFCNQQQEILHIYFQKQYSIKGSRLFKSMPRYLFS